MISFSRIFAIFMKELVQMRRDRLTFAVMIIVPIMQLALFGFAIDTDPRHMPTVVELRDDGPLTRALLAGLHQSRYFDIVAVARDDETSERLLRSGKANFLIVVPESFERDLVRGARPEILVAADATDPVAAGGALSAVDRAAARALSADLARLSHLRVANAPYDIVIHRRYNPAGVTAYNIVPGLLGVILTMTLIMIASIALVRERERGTIEALLSTPVRPLEVMIAKTTPYIFVGLVQASIVLLAARFVFGIPFTGAPSALAAGLALFLFANLMLGYLISTVARTQMQAMQMTFFVFLPSILLSGFMFPFRAMPGWAQAIGECLPITHFLRVVRATVLKGAGLGDVVGELWPLAAIVLTLGLAALSRFRQTLD